MQDEEKKGVPEVNNSSPTIVQTDVGAKDGQEKCPKCGSTDISLNVSTGKLRCNFCRHEFESEKISGMQTNIKELSGEILGSGAKDIIADTKDVLTFKCSSCGAEVVVDTASSAQARCHWCRNILSVNQQIPNGAIPDVVLPFSVTKDVAKGQIEKFVGSRKFFAHPKFKKEFTTQNIMGVYFPYMLVDINSHVKLVGQGEKLVRTYTRGSDENSRTYYDADLFNVKREFDFSIEGLTVESNSDRLNNTSAAKTNNVINAIMPFDIENCVKYNANFLRGYTSERRDINIEQLKPLVKEQAQDIARFAANESLTEYNRGVAWSQEDFDVKGQQWKAAYLPVWLYSYQQIKGNKSILHYVAVNARTKETMGSVPIHMPLLILVSLFVEFLGYLGMTYIDFDYNFIFLLSGVLYFIIMYSRYRNSGARHKHELETKNEVRNLQRTDNYVKRLTELQNSHMSGANNTSVNGSFGSGNIINTIVDNININIK